MWVIFGVVWYVSVNDHTFRHMWRELNRLQFLKKKNKKEDMKRNPVWLDINKPYYSEATMFKIY